MRQRSTRAVAVLRTRFLHVTVASVLLAAPVRSSIIDWVEAVDIEQETFHTAVLSVSADEENWVAVDDGTAELRLRATGRCKKPSKVVRSTVYLDRAGGYDVLFNYANQGFGGPRTWDRLVTKSVGLNAGERQVVVAACRAEMARLLDRGDSRREILSENHLIDGPPIFRMRHYFGCDGELLNVDQETAGPKPVEMLVLCRRSTVLPPPHPTGPGNLQQSFGVTSATVEVDPNHANVVSRANLEVDAEIAVNGPGKVRFRLVHNGTPSEVGTLIFSKAGARQLTYPLVVRCDQPPASGGGGGFSSGPSDLHNGTVRVEILEPAAGVRHSEEAPYSVNCTDPGTVVTPLPDFTILDVKVGSGKALVRIRNRGVNGPATKLRATRAGGAPQQVDVPALGSGEEIDVDIPLPLGNQRSPVTFTVDPDHTVPESDESNNQAVH